jgi:hypothetical protein
MKTTFFERQCEGHDAAPNILGKDDHGSFGFVDDAADGIYFGTVFCNLRGFKHAGCIFSIVKCEPFIVGSGSGSFFGTSLTVIIGVTGSMLPPIFFFLNDRRWAILWRASSDPFGNLGIFVRFVDLLICFIVCFVFTK